MALIYTPKANQQFSIPNFNLPAMEGRNFSNIDFKSKVKVFLFICNHCPYVKAIETRIIKLAKSYKDVCVDFISVCSNDSEEYPEDSFERLQSNWKNKNFNFPYLHDENQDLAKKFSAVCTPDIFVFNKNDSLFYRGRFDDNWKDENKVTRQELKIAIDDALNDSKLSFSPTPSMGCSIKWK